MNEQILGIAKQCGYWNGQTIEMNDVGITKFAELIVRECVEVSINNGCGDFVDIEQKLFKHFGVSDDQQN